MRKNPPRPKDTNANYSPCLGCKNLTSHKSGYCDDPCRTIVCKVCKEVKAVSAFGVKVCKVCVSKENRRRSKVGHE